MLIYPGVTRALDLLVASKDHEVVCAGIECWIDDKRVHRRTVNRLIQMMAVSETTDEGGGLRRYSLNNTGRSIRRRPELCIEVLQAVARHQAFTIREDKVVPMGEPSIGSFG